MSCLESCNNSSHFAERKAGVIMGCPKSAWELRATGQQRRVLSHGKQLGLRTGPVLCSRWVSSLLVALQRKSPREKQVLLRTCCLQGSGPYPGTREPSLIPSLAALASKGRSLLEPTCTSLFPGWGGWKPTGSLEGINIYKTAQMSWSHLALLLPR